MEYYRYVNRALLFFAVVFVVIGIIEWRKQARLETTQVACLAHHSVSECKELK